MRLRAQKARIFTQKKFCPPKCNDAYLCQQKIKTVLLLNGVCGKWSPLTRRTRLEVTPMSDSKSGRLSPELITNCINELAQEVGVMGPEIQGGLQFSKNFLN